MHYFIKAIAIFSDKDGVQHVGDLLSQHLLVLGAAVGIYPLTFLTFGEIGDTKSRASFQDRFGLFTSDDGGGAVESTIILKALGYYLQETVMYCENLSCKEVQHIVTKTAGRWVDSFYKEQRGLYHVNIDSSTNIVLELIQENRKEVVNIPLSMYPKKSDKLHMQLQEMGTDIFQRKTKQKVSPKSRKKKKS